MECLPACARAPEEGSGIDPVESTIHKMEIQSLQAQLVLSRKTCSFLADQLKAGCGFGSLGSWGIVGGPGVCCRESKGRDTIPAHGDRPGIR